MDSSLYPKNLKNNIQSLGYVTFAALILVIMLGFLIRFTLPFISGLVWFSTDTYDYINMADAIIAGHPIAKFPNGLPLLIAIIKIFVKPELMPKVLIFINVILSTSIIWMAALITTKITNKKFIGIITALIVSLYPNQINYTRFILSEVPACFLLTLSIFLFLKKNFFLSGFILFLATFFRSDLLLVFPLLFAISLYFLCKNDKIAKAFYFCTGYMLGILFSFMLLNYGVIASTNRYGLEILKSLNADSLKEEYPSIANFKEDEKLHPIRTYIQFILNNPTTYLKQRLFALENMWGWPLASNRNLIAKILIAIRFPIFILGIIGFWKYRNNFDAWVLFIPILALSIIHVATYSSPRYTFTVEPLLICLASISLSKRQLINESIRG
ncbi:MAG: glycosyl transferase family protein [uncultured bacterium]|nr:MAG: glycosyl transferase family protein [uncultured bacterium]